MAFVSVPKDLTKVKNKVVLNLTKRQLLCLSIAAAMGLPFYFLTKDWIGTSNAATGMVILMVPAFLFAMYEKDGMIYKGDVVLTGDYSIVDSLAELSTVRRVQIRINGSQDDVFRDQIPLSTVFERNYDYIVGGKND